MIFFIYFYISYFVFLYNICFVACDMFDESFKIPIWLKLGYVLWFLLYTEANVHRCSSIGVFLWNLPNFKEFGKFHRKAPVLESPFNKLQVFRPATLLKRLQHRCFPVNFLRTYFFAYFGCFFIQRRV